MANKQRDLVKEARWRETLERVVSGPYPLTPFSS